ncbi:hypothetical protein G3M53_12590, partial [Streptomyces sp. SID7982]|nr:hypothetical protein [Streptomyces sp. SID7982]
GLKITAFAAALAATFGSAYAVGGAMDPAAGKEPSHQDAHGAKERPAAEKDAARTPELPGGLQISQGGYALDLDTPRVEA